MAASRSLVVVAEGPHIDRHHRHHPLVARQAAAEVRDDQVVHRYLQVRDHPDRDPGSARVEQVVRLLRVWVHEARFPVWGRNSHRRRRRVRLRWIG